MTAVVSEDIVLFDGILFVTDSGHIWPSTPISDEQFKQGFATFEHMAMVMTDYEYCECKLEVCVSKPIIPETCQLVVSFSLDFDSGQCCIGDNIILDDATFAIDLLPGRYTITIAQELISEDIEAVGDTAAIKLTVWFVQEQ